MLFNGRILFYMLTGQDIGYLPEMCYNTAIERYLKLTARQSGPNLFLNFDVFELNDVLFEYGLPLP